MTPVIRSVALLCFAVLLLPAISLHAEIVSAADLPENHVDAGIFYNTYGSPIIRGWGAYAHKIGTGNTYNFDFADVTTGQKNLSDLKVTTTGGLAQLLTQFGGFNVFGVGALGVTTTPGGGSTGFAGTGGFILIRPIRTGWTLDVPIRVIAGTGPPQYVFGIGVGWGK